jgi:hypothetical protein
MIHHRRGNTIGRNFPNFGTLRTYGTFEVEHNGHSRATFDCYFCTVSLATCNKLFEIFAPGDKVRSRINVWTGNQTTSWLFDTRAAIT